MKTKHKKAAFTIVELLTVMSIIIILISLLVPALNGVKRFSRVVLQKNQFRNIGSGLQVYESDFQEYPDSSATDADQAKYCGAMKLAEVMAGQDGLGFNLNSRLTINGQDSAGNNLYPAPGSIPQAAYLDNLRSRKEYLEPKYVQICALTDLYGTGAVAPFSKPGVLLCDVFNSVRSKNTGKRIGMPILYYRADTSKMSHDVNNPTNADNIYNYLDNQDFLKMGLPWQTATKPPLCGGIGGTSTPEGQMFYENTLDQKSPFPRPYNKDSYLLISAGWDGIYGTKDDVYNFEE
jgi:type II secretory pathway pseudopilin PulG